MVMAIRIYETGGPEVMQYENVDLDAPGPGMVTVANHAIGLNYIDTYHRGGLYPMALPSGLGLEGAGRVEVCLVGARRDVRWLRSHGSWKWPGESERPRSHRTQGAGYEKVAP